MKILWIKSDFLHPTNKGGQIRTLEMLRCLHRRHEVHYVGFANPEEPEGVVRSAEYCSRSYPIDLKIPAKTSLRFQFQLLAGLASEIPAGISRYRSATMRQMIETLLTRGRFDRVVCDFLVPSINLPSMEGVVLFQHNVESVIWQRRAEHAANSLDRWYLQLQADRMFQYEDAMCSAAGYVVAVSPVDARLMQNLFGLSNVSHVQTGVDLDYFARPPGYHMRNDLVFVGSMDWSPNIEGVIWFVQEALPLIWRKLPATRLSIVGRQPAREIVELGQRDSRISVTGTVPDVRPYLWGAGVSVVPLRIGGGTRLKIYEAMAARVPTVSTRVGAEGLVADAPGQIRIADDAAGFAAQCVELLSDEAGRARMAQSAWELVNEQFTWEVVTRQFEHVLESGQQPRLAASGA